MRSFFPLELYADGRGLVLQPELVKLFEEEHAFELKPGRDCKIRDEEGSELPLDKVDEAGGQTVNLNHSRFRHLLSHLNVSVSARNSNQTDLNPASSFCQASATPLLENAALPRSRTQRAERTHPPAPELPRQVREPAHQPAEAHADRLPRRGGRHMRLRLPGAAAAVSALNV
jgi:hypothetical protein